MANSYCTAVDVRATMTTSGLTQVDDTLLTELAKRASRMIDQYCGRPPGWFYADADTTRYYHGSGCYEQRIDECASITSVSVDEVGDRIAYTAWVSGTDYDPLPFNAALEGRPYTALGIDALISNKVYWYPWPRAVKIVGKFGWGIAVPDDIKGIAVIQTIRWLKRAQQSFADVGAIVELGQVKYAQALDPEVAAMIVTPGYTRVTI